MTIDFDLEQIRKRFDCTVYFSNADFYIFALNIQN